MSDAKEDFGAWRRYPLSWRLQGSCFLILFSSIWFIAGWWMYRRAQQATEEELLTAQDRAFVELEHELSGTNRRLQTLREQGEQKKADELEAWLVKRKAAQLKERAENNRKSQKMNAYGLFCVGIFFLIGIFYCLFRPVDKIESATG